MSSDQNTSTLTQLGYAVYDAHKMHPLVKKIITEKSIKRSMRYGGDPTDCMSDLLPHSRMVKYIVREGDTILGLALRFSTTVKAIQTLNKLQVNDKIHKGQNLLLLPQGSADDVNAMEEVLLNMSVQERVEFYEQTELTMPAESLQPSGNYSVWGPDEVDMESETNEEQHRQRQAEAAATSVVPHALRCFLRIKSGNMLESSAFRKFQRVWCLLVDQHFLVFPTPMSRRPKRIIYLHNRSCMATRTACTMCLSFDVEVVGATPSWVPSKLFYKLNDEREAEDWKELFMTIAAHSVGTSMRDGTCLSFGDFFRDITMISASSISTESDDGCRSIDTDAGTDVSKNTATVFEPNESTMSSTYPLRWWERLYSDAYVRTITERRIRLCEWEWMRGHGPQGGMRFTGDCVADDGLDGLWDIDNGRIALEENPSILRVMLLRCRSILAQQDDSTVLQQDGNPVVDQRVKKMLVVISRDPEWVSGTSLRRAGNLLIRHISWVLAAVLSHSLVEIASSAEGAALFASLASTTENADSPGESDTDKEVKKDSLLFQIALQQSVAWSSQDMEHIVTRVVSIVYQCSLAASTGCLIPYGAAWVKLIELRLALAVARRRILSICGVGRWDEKFFGMPLSQQFLGYCIGRFASDTIFALRKTAGTLSERSIEDVLHFWAYIGHVIGIREEYNPCRDKYSIFQDHICVEHSARSNPPLSSIQPTKAAEKEAYLEDTPSDDREVYLYLPHNDLEYIESLVHNILRASCAVPIFSGSWSVRTQETFSWIFQPSNRVRLKFSVLTYLWLELCMIFSRIISIIVTVFGLSHWELHRSRNACKTIESYLSIQSEEIADLDVENIHDPGLWSDDERVKSAQSE